MPGMPKSNRSVRPICLDPFWTGRSLCGRCAVRQSMPFAPLQHEDLEQALLPIDSFRIPAGTRLQQSGAGADTVLTLRRGLVKVVEDLPSGRHRILRLLRAGDVVGLEALATLRYQHAADALTEIEACRIPISVIEQMSRLRPQLHASLTQRWNENLAQAERIMLDLLSGEVQVRIARLLCMLDDIDEPEAHFRMSRQDMAALVDTSPETASRICSAFLQSGWLHEEGQGFQIDRGALQRICAA